jgi:hypothetical protein
MIGRLLLLFALAAGLVLAIHWFTRTDPKKLARQLKRALPWVLGAALLVLAIVGRQWLLALAAIILPLLNRVLALLRYVPVLSQLVTWLQNARASSSGPVPGASGSSQVATRFLRMTLAHDSGAMDGEILDGRHRGRRLSTLALSELLELLGDYQAEDSDSAALLAAYLDREHGTEWRTTSGPASGAATAPTRGGMSVGEARAVLGVDEGATREAVIAAHRRLMQKLHPDRGGSDYLAAKINQAKEVLLQTANSK